MRKRDPYVEAVIRRHKSTVADADVADAIKAGKTFIYFLRSGEYVKIGQSRGWRGRLAQMQTGSPHTIVPLLVIIDEPRLERRLHIRFRASRFRGEWFHMSPVISAYIKENLSRCVAQLGNISDLRQTWNSWSDVEL